MSTASPLAPVLGLPQHGTIAEELRLVSLLTASPRGLSFADLAGASADAMVTYAALFALLTRGTVVTAELPDGGIGYRRRVRRRSAAIASVEHQRSLRLAA